VRETVVEAAQLTRLPGGRGKDLLVRGGATLRGLDLSGMRWSQLWLQDGAPGRNGLLPRALRSRRGLLVFEGCTFDGLDVRHLDVGRSRFVGCSFRDVSIGLAVRGGHFIDCIFSGQWNGNFYANPDNGDVARVTQVRGNDFTGVSGISFYGGVPWDANRFDIGRHVLIRRGGPGWEAVKATAAADPDLATTVSSLEGHGPMGYDQDWQLAEREHCTPRTWRTLLEHCVGPGDR